MFPVEPQWAIFFNVWNDEPIFHRLAHPMLTRCGRKVGIHVPMFPYKHAKKLGRPCKGCFE